MEKAVSCIILFSILNFSCVRKMNWDDMTRFRIYDFNFNNKVWANLSENELRNINFIDPNLVDTKSLMKKSKRIGNRGYLWKGKYLAIATFSTGEKRQILLSKYGGFFFDIEDQCFYEFEDESRAEWDTYLQKYKEQLMRLRSN